MTIREGLRWRGSSTDGLGGGRRERSRRSAGFPRSPSCRSALGVVVAAIELWPIVTAWSLGVTEWWAELPQRLPVAARSGAMLLLPAAVAWGDARPRPAEPVAVDGRADRRVRRSSCAIP